MTDIQDSLRQLEKEGDDPIQFFANNSEDILGNDIIVVTTDKTGKQVINTTKLKDVKSISITDEYLSTTAVKTMYDETWYVDKGFTSKQKHPEMTLKF